MDSKIITIVVVALVCIILVWWYLKSGQKQGYKAIDGGNQRYLVYEDEEPAVNTQQVMYPPSKEGYKPNSEGKTGKGYMASSGNEQTIFDPDFYLNLGKDSGIDAKKRIKTLEEMRYSTPAELMTPDSATILDDIVQSENVQHVVFEWINWKNKQPKSLTGKYRLFQRRRSNCPCREYEHFTTCFARFCESGIL